MLMVSSSGILTQYVLNPTSLFLRILQVMIRILHLMVARFGVHCFLNLCSVRLELLVCLFDLWVSERKERAKEMILGGKGTYWLTTVYAMPTRRKVGLVLSFSYMNYQNSTRKNWSKNEWILEICEFPPSNVTVMSLEEESPLSYVLRSPCLEEHGIQAKVKWNFYDSLLIPLL